MRKRTSQRMGDVAANGGSSGGANGGSSGGANGGSSGGSSVVRRRDGPNIRAQRIVDIVAEWETDHGPIVQQRCRSYTLSENLPEYDEDNVDLEDDSENDSTIKKTCRGRANAWDGWGKEKKIIEWDKNCYPIGENAAKLASHLGTYARNGTWFPLYWTSWNGMSESTLESVWKDVQANTNAPDGYKSICFKRLNRAWKAFKHDLKKKYYWPHDTDAQRLVVTPPEVKAEQWSELVKYWSLQSTYETSKKNRHNRGNLCAHPRIGRTSIPNIIHKRKKNNEPTDLISIWRATRCKNGKYTEDDGAAGLEETLQRRLDELPEEERDDAEKRKKIFLDVIGSDGHGRVICGGTRSSTLSQTSAPLIHDYEDEIARLREVIAERDRRDEERDRRDEERDLRHQEQIADLRSQLQVTLQSTADSEARVIRMLQSAGISTILSSIPSPIQSSGHGSTSRNQTT